MENCTTNIYDSSRKATNTSTTAARIRRMGYDCCTNTNKIVTTPRRATTVLNMLKMIVAFPDLCRSSTVRPESWRFHHERVTDVSRFIAIS